MDVIKMYENGERIRQIIYIYNESFMKQYEVIEIKNITLYMEELYRIGMLDIGYWENSTIDFQLMHGLIGDLDNAITSMDLVSIYDKLNYELWIFIKEVFEVLFDKSNDILKNYFKHENNKALTMRFPQIIEELKSVYENGRYVGVRTYGLIGKVVYRKRGNIEVDLFSAYGLLGLKTSRWVDYKKYNKIYLWGCNGGFEINEMMLWIILYEDIDIEVYVTDLYEFKLIISNTLRKGVLLNPRINWNFNCREENLINDFDIQKKANSYIYICEHRDRLTLLEEFICKSSLNSNIGEWI